MRIRRVQMDWGTGKADLDLRHENNIPLQAIGIVGGNDAGKTMLMNAVLRTFRSALHDLVSFEDWKQVSCNVEYDLGSAISTSVIKDGKIVQKLVYPEMLLEEAKLSGGILFYSTNQRAFFATKEASGRSFGQSLIYTVLNDLYKHKVTNSVIWVDDYNLGLSDDSALDFLQVLIRKSMEGDNQLIVSAHREAVLQGIGSQGIRVLRPSGTKAIEAVLKSMK